MGTILVTLTFARPILALIAEARDATESRSGASSRWLAVNVISPIHLAASLAVSRPLVICSRMGFGARTCPAASFAWRSASSLLALSRPVRSCPLPSFLTPHVSVLGVGRHPDDKLDGSVVECLQEQGVDPRVLPVPGRGPRQPAVDGIDTRLAVDA